MSHSTATSPSPSSPSSPRLPSANSAGQPAAANANNFVTEPRSAPPGTPPLVAHIHPHSSSASAHHHHSLNAPSSSILQHIPTASLSPVIDASPRPVVPVSPMALSARSLSTDGPSGPTASLQKHSTSSLRSQSPVFSHSSNPQRNESPSPIHVNWFTLSVGDSVPIESDSHEYKSLHEGKDATPKTVATVMKELGSDHYKKEINAFLNSRHLLNGGTLHFGIDGAKYIIQPGIKVTGQERDALQLRISQLMQSFAPPVQHGSSPFSPWRLDFVELTDQNGKPTGTTRFDLHVAPGSESVYDMSSDRMEAWIRDGARATKMARHVYERRKGFAPPSLSVSGPFSPPPASTMNNYYYSDALRVQLDAQAIWFVRRVKADLKAIMYRPWDRVMQLLRTLDALDIDENKYGPPVVEEIIRLFKHITDRVGCDNHPQILRFIYLFTRSCISVPLPPAVLNAASSIAADITNEGMLIASLDVFQYGAILQAVLGQVSHDAYARACRDCGLDNDGLPLASSPLVDPNNPRLPTNDHRESPLLTEMKQCKLEIAHRYEILQSKVAQLEQERNDTTRKMSRYLTLLFEWSHHKGSPIERYSIEKEMISMGMQWF